MSLLQPADTVLSILYVNIFAHFCRVNNQNYTMSDSMVFPYAAIVGQENFKLALELCLVDRSIGGVLVAGDKGTGKTTTVRSLSALMRDTGDFPFVNLPVGASEDRVLGAVDLEKLINEKRQVLQRGLLAQANGGILYIDEVNLLPDYLTDILLDAAATGGYYLEREGLSAWQESRFSLVGTMNPEEGSLRPQLLDRFGLGVDVKTSQLVSERVRIAQRRVTFDVDPAGFMATFAQQQEAVRTRLLQASRLLTQVQMPDAVYAYASELCIRHGVEGVRGDVLLIKAGRAYAALQGRDILLQHDIDHVAPFVLRYRSKTPPSSAGNTPPDGGMNGAGDASKEQPANTPAGQPGSQRILEAAATEQGVKLFRKRTGKATDKGKAVKADVAVFPRASGKPADARIDVLKSVAQYTLSGNFKVVYKPASGHSSLLVIFLVDSSGSMLQNRQLQYCKGLISHTLSEHAGKRIYFAGIGLLNGAAELFEAGTTDVGVFMESLHNFHTGGRTNLTSGFEKVALLLRQRPLLRHAQKHLYILTDGKVNTGTASAADPLKEAAAFYHMYLKSLRYTQVLNTERGFVKLGHARVLADALNAHYVTVS